MATVTVVKCDVCMSEMTVEQSARIHHDPEVPQYILNLLDTMLDYEEYEDVCPSCMRTLVHELLNPITAVMNKFDAQVNKIRSNSPKEQCECIPTTNQPTKSQS